MLSQIDYYYSIQPCLGERVSGDAVIVEEKEKWVFIAIIDALGHGVKAHEVSRVARTYLEQYWSQDVRRTMQLLDLHLQDSLGAAVGLGVIDLETNQLTYTGVGNTVIRILRRQAKPAHYSQPHSAAGIVGSYIPHPAEQKIQLHTSDLILMYSDGIKERFDLQEYPSIFTDDVMTISKKLVRKYGKNYDDATCIALKFKM